MSTPECKLRSDPTKCPKCGREMYYNEMHLQYFCPNTKCENSWSDLKREKSPVIKYEKGCPPVVKDLRFQPGDVVRLKSDGPDMTVTFNAGEPKGKYVDCCWFDKNDILHNNTFNVLSLEIAPARERLLKYTSEKSGIEQPYQRPENSNGQAATCKSKLLGDPEIDVFSLCTLPKK